jgi:cytochrome P450
MTEPMTQKSRAVILPRHKAAPGPRGHLLFGNVRDIQRDPLGFGSTMSRQYGNVVRMRFFIWPAYLINHPDGVKHVLQENQQNYNKDLYPYKIFKPLLGRGLVTNDGKSWLHQRRLMQPAFHRKRLDAFGSLMTDATVTMLDQWQDFATRDQPLDIAAEMLRLTLRIVGQTLFNIDLSDETQIVGQAVTTVNKLLSDYIYAPFPPFNVPTSRNRRLQVSYRALDQVVHDIITHRRNQYTDTGDLLSMLLLARDEETGQGMDDQQVRDEVITLLIAGHETVSTALTWTWYLLSQYPHVERQLHTELDNVLGGHLPKLEHLARLSYTRMVLEEALRLYPPAWIFGRKAIADDEIGGYAIPANSIIVLSPYITHRHPAFWGNPEVFDPERFIPKRSADRPHFAYFPFGGGPRVCIGNNFALMEMQLILATVAQRYKLRLVPGHPVEPEAFLSLRPRYGLPMTLHRR